MTRGIRYSIEIIITLILVKSDTLNAQGKFMYPVDEKGIQAQKDMPYKDAGSSKLHFDIYQPSSGPSQSAPLVILFNGFGAADVKNASYMVSWAKAIASDGMTAVTFESHVDGAAEDFDDIYKYLCVNREKFHLDTTRVIVMASSGHAYYGLPAVFSPSRNFIHAAVIYYAAGPIQNFKWDMPVLLVRAGRDNPVNDRRIDTMILRAMEHNAPWTIINHHSGGHPFEFGAPDAQSIMIIRQTLAFMHRAVSDSLQRSIRENSDFIIAATAGYTGNWGLAIEKYKILTQKYPDDSDNYMKLGYAYFGMQDYHHALEAFQKSLDLGDGRLRDLSVPASLSAARLHDQKVTLFWLGYLAKAPNGKNIILESREYDFIKHDPAYMDIVK